MKKLIYTGLIFLFACTNKQAENNTETAIAGEGKQQQTETESADKEATQICWKGKINSKTNILLHYQIEDDLIIGKITYLDTKEKTPIRIIGTIEEDQNFRLLEFDKTGNITGIITGLHKGSEFTGSWFSPKTRKELVLNLSRIDTIIPVENMKTNVENIIGEYHYQYSQAGSQGDLTIKKVNPNKISFSIFSVTDEPARNIADIETDTIKATTDFIYKVPETDSCEFRIRFFKDFAYINYTRGYCHGMFGNNATIDGIFYKQK